MSSLFCILFKILSFVEGITNLVTTILSYFVEEKQKTGPNSPVGWICDIL